MATVEQRTQELIDSLDNKKAGYNWLALCKSNTAFLKTWKLGRAGRRLAFLASQAKKSEAKGAARGYVVSRHAEIALEKLARKVRSAVGQIIADFLHFGLMLGIWAARAVARVMEVPIQRRPKGSPWQSELALPIFSV